MLRAPIQKQGTAAHLAGIWLLQHGASGTLLVRRCGGRRLATATRGSSLRALLRFEGIKGDWRTTRRHTDTHLTCSMLQAAANCATLWQTTAAQMKLANDIGGNRSAHLLDALGLAGGSRGSSSRLARLAVLRGTSRLQAGWGRGMGGGKVELMRGGDGGGEWEGRALHQCRENPLTLDCTPMRCTAPARRLPAERRQRRRQAADLPGQWREAGRQRREGRVGRAAVMGLRGGWLVRKPNTRQAAAL